MKLNALTSVLLTDQVETANEVGKVLLKLQQNGKIRIERFVIDRANGSIDELRSDEINVTRFEILQHVNVHLRCFNRPVGFAVQIISLEN